MPYIEKKLRGMVSPGLDAVCNTVTLYGSGVLNYTITRIVHAFLGGAPGYDRFNTALGVLEAVKLELYRRMVAPYEDQKCAQNGDVA